MEVQPFPEIGKYHLFALGLVIGKCHCFALGLCSSSSFFYFPSYFFHYYPSPCAVDRSVSDELLFSLLSFTICSGQASVTRMTFFIIILHHMQWTGQCQTNYFFHYYPSPYAVDRPVSDFVCVFCHMDCHSRIGLVNHTRRCIRINT